MEIKCQTKEEFERLDLIRNELYKLLPSKYTTGTISYFEFFSSVSVEIDAKYNLEIIFSTEFLKTKIDRIIINNENHYIVIWINLLKTDVSLKFLLNDKCGFDIQISDVNSKFGC
jgi:hypothetical protein